MLALQPLPHDLQVQQAEEAHPEAEAERSAGLRLVHQGRVVQAQLVQGLAQRRVLAAVQRIQAAEHHRPRVAVPAERLCRRVAHRGQGVAHPGLPDVLDPRG